MTAAELAQAFEDAGHDDVAYEMRWELGGTYNLRLRSRETAAMAIAEARVREMWAKRGYPAYQYTQDVMHSVVFREANMGGTTGAFVGHTLADCLHAALQAALEAPDGE